MFVVALALAACNGETTAAPTTTAGSTTTGTGTTAAPTSVGTTTTAPTTPASTGTTTEFPLSQEVTLNMAINYTSGGQLMSISYQKEAAYVSTIDDTTYTKGDLLPVWATIGDILKVNFVDMATSSDPDTNSQWDRLESENFAGVDMVNGTGQLIGPAGVDGNFVDIAKYLDDMPFFKAFLEANPSVRVSITSADGGIYFTPYFDGFGELENMFLCRIDWVEDILDAANTDAFDIDPATKPTEYTRRQIPVPIDVDIIVANPESALTDTRVVEKNYTVNILNALAQVANPTGKALADVFRAHIQNTYGDQGYAKLSDVFVGVDAAYDTDELMALMYVVKANPKYLTREHAAPLSEVEVLFPREAKGNRVANLIRGMEFFGLRGVFSRCENLYFDATGTIQDIRHEQKFLDAIADLNALFEDDLIYPILTGGANIRKQLLEGSNGFITYDYNGTSTTTGLIDKGNDKDPTYKFEAILPPVCDWLGNGTYFHFSESVRSIKNEAWGIPIQVESNPGKLQRALMLMDGLYDYSTVNSIGTIHLYGPVGWTDGTIEYGSDVVYKLSNDALAEIADPTVGNGSHINYLRQYVGATMPIGHIRSLGLEYQTLSDQGKESVERINRAVEVGTFKLAGQIASTDEIYSRIPATVSPLWFQLSPTFYPLTKAENDIIVATCAWIDLYDDNALSTLVQYGFTGEGGSVTEAAYWQMFVMGNYDLYDDVYIKGYRNAYNRLQEDE